MQVESFLEDSARRYADKTALVCGGSRLTYGEIEDKANRLANSLIAQGVERGDRVCVYLDNSVEAVISIFAILKAGAVFLAINPTTKAEKLAYVLNNCRAKGLILPGTKIGSLEATIAGLAHLKVIYTVGETTAGASISAKAICDFQAVIHDGSPASPPR